MDEASTAQGHYHITLFIDLKERKTVFITDGKGSETVREFTTNLEEHNGNTENIKQVSCNMSPECIKDVREALTKTEVTFDKFHIIKIINEAVDSVRREEVKTNPLLAGARCVLLKNENNLTAKQKTIRNGLRLLGLNLKPVQVLPIRDTFQYLYTAPDKDG